MNGAYFLIFLGILCQEMKFVKAEGKSYKNRHKCSFWQQSGCLLMSLQTFCQLPQHEIRDNIDTYVKHLERCCCPLPFKECTNEEENHLCRVNYEKKLLVDTIKGKDELIQRVNDLRKRLIEEDKKCEKYLAPAEPFHCSKQYKPQFARKDLRCELLLWQYEELGIVDKTELEDNKCSFEKSKAAPEKATSRFVASEQFKEQSDTIEASQPDDQSYKIQSYKQRRKCKFWQQSGCLLNVLESACQANPNQKKLFYKFLTEKDNIYLCCCPNPYKACRRSEAHTVCLELLHRYFSPDSYKTQKSISQEEILNGVQLARERILDNDKKCARFLAPSQPFARCSKKPVGISRHDLKCEQLTWRLEELGEGNPKDFDAIHCPFVSKNKAKDGKLRKGFKAFIGEGNSEKDEL